MKTSIRIGLPLIAGAVGLAGSLLLSACGGGHSAVPPAPPIAANTQATQVDPYSEALSLQSTSCYSGDKHSAYTAKATVTFYGYPDNSPPSADIAHPVIHSKAGGNGTYCNPTTFATEPTSSENKKIPYGTRIYVPLVKKYFIREDDCTSSGPSVGSGSNSCYGLWFDLWIGGDSHSNTNAVVSCEDKLTPSSKVTVIIHPRSNEPVSFSGPIYSDKHGCNKG